MTTQHTHSRTLIAVFTVALVAGTSGALASADGGRDYGSAELVQLGHGPGGPPLASVSVTRTASSVTGRDYGSAELVQLGHGPGGPPPSGRS